MNIINIISRYIYAFSIVEYTVFLLFFTWVYLKIKHLAQYKSVKLWNIVNAIFILIFVFVVLYKVVFSREIGSVVAKPDFIPLSSYFEYFKGENSEAFLPTEPIYCCFFLLDCFSMIY